MNECNIANYYAVIPSEVRYCEELKFAERLLYGEITALAGKEGYCFASNRYFAELYKVIPGTISRWISHLESLGFVRTEIIKDDRNQIIERRIYINDKHRDFLSNTYKQKKQYHYEQNKTYPISKKAKDNNININIDRFFNYIIKKDKQQNEIFTKENQEDFYKILEQLDFNYTEEFLEIFTEENIEKIKIIIYSLKELYISSRKILIAKLKREDLIFLYNSCKDKEKEYENTDKEIKNFFEYYYISLIRSLEKAK